MPVSFVRLAVFLGVCHLLLAGVGFVGTRREDGPIRILFIGNSLTAFNDVGGMVKSLIESDGSGKAVQVKTIFAAHLEDAYHGNEAVDAIKNGRWSVVVLQGAQISSSHRYAYTQEGTIGLAKLAKQAGARTLYFSEWSRRGENESGYIFDVYKADAKQSGAEIVPVGFAWDAALSKKPSLPLLVQDGNHATTMGSYLAALTFYRWIAGSERSPKWKPQGVDDATVRLFDEAARSSLKGAKE